VRGAAPVVDGRGAACDEALPLPAILPEKVQNPRRFALTSSQVRCRELCISWDLAVPWASLTEPDFHATVAEWTVRFDFARLAAGYRFFGIPESPLETL
jgi:hypothetical protein